MPNKFRILDCTLRDGGYYNNWDFSDEFVNAYFHAVQKSPISIIEIGFRSCDKSTFKGPLAYTTTEYLSSFKIIPKLKQNKAVMVNASEIKSFGQKSVISLFQKNDPFIDTIRFAANASEVDDIIEISPKLKKLGYSVVLNLMKASSLDNNFLNDLIAKIEESAIDVFYLADSYGALFPEDVQKLYKTLSKLKKPVGIHAHNNLNLGLLNTLEAGSNGAKYLDSTILGMGRGAGNCKTEELLEIFKFKNILKTKFPVHKLIFDEIVDLQKHYQWGSNYLYFVAGLNSIHPTYVQVLEADNRYEKQKKFNFLDSLKNSKGLTFNKDVFLTSQKQINQKTNTSLSLKRLKEFKKKKILIIGAGPSTEQYKNHLDIFINKEDPLIIGINKVRNFPQNSIDFSVFLNEQRFLADLDELDTKKVCFLGSSLSNFTHNMKQAFFFDIKTDELEISNSVSRGMKVLSNHTAQFGLLLASIIQPETIYLIGFDGEDDSESFNSMNIFFQEFVKRYKQEVISLSPTQYKIKSRSIFSI